MLTKLEAVKELDGYDHCYLTVEGAQRIAEPFGITVKAQWRENDPQGFKGLNVPGVEVGKLVDGYDAADLAEVICEHENVAYLKMFGRGSRLHAACDALLTSLQSSEPRTLESDLKEDR